MIPKRLLLFHATHFEKWGPRTPDERGIGNSETCQIELAKSFAKRGWEVYSFAPLPDGEEGLHDGVHWLPLEAAQSNVPGHWIIWRQPEVLDKFALDHPDQQVNLLSQDEGYPGRWTDERVAKLDMLFALCQSHRESLRSDHPGLYEKARVSSNGIRMDLIREVEREPAPTRNPHRIMFASSPDRGLLQLLQIFSRVREWVHDAELHCFYGTQNMRVLAAQGGHLAYFGRIADQIEKAVQQPGVFWHGRVSQPEILREWRKSALLVSPTLFRETSFVSIQEAQAMGAIPVVSPQWAAIENLCGGAFVQGDPADPLVSAQFVHLIRWLMASQTLQDQIRGPMMADARMRFSWDRQVDKYEAFLLGFADHPGLQHSQFNFQVKQCLGAESILNVGCADDPANLKALGATNIDSREADPIFGRPTKADIIADIRDLPLNGDRYARVVAGDILEHFQPQYVPRLLSKLKACLAPGGKLVLTIPDDHRPPDQQHAGSDGSDLYSSEVSACHLHPVPFTMVEDWLQQAGLQLVEYQPIDCGHYINHGLTAVPIP